MTLVAQPGDAGAAAGRRRRARGDLVARRGCAAVQPPASRPRIAAVAGTGAGDPLLIYVGRLAPEKNLGELLQAFARLRAALPPGRASGCGWRWWAAGRKRQAIARAAHPGVYLAGEQHGAGAVALVRQRRRLRLPVAERDVRQRGAGGAGVRPAGGRLRLPGGQRTGDPEVDGLLVPVGGDLLTGPATPVRGSDAARTSWPGGVGEGADAGLETDL